jgi:putative phosphoesterase
MRVAALYDVHGNLPALDAVLEDVERERPDAIVFGGDIVAGPLPRETLERVPSRGEEARLIRGNADRAVAAMRRDVPAPSLGPNRDALEWVAARLTDEQLDLLAALPLTITLEVDGVGSVCFCHATPRDDEEIFTERTPDEVVEELLVETVEEVVVCGHTHMQFDRLVNRWRVVNAGSVGMPYDEGKQPRWAMLGPDISLRSTELDRVRAVDMIRASGSPQAEDFLAGGPSREEALDLFEHWATQQRGA